MDAAQIRTRLTDWMSSWVICPSPAARSIAVSLGAAWLHEHPEADLSVSQWSDVPRLIDAAIQGGEQSVAQLEAIEQQFAQKPPLALIAADADQIQAYVFESAKIPEVRGASALVEWLNLEGLKQVVENLGLPEEVIIYRGGGGAMLLVPSVKADEVQERVEEQFVSMTHVATITTVKRYVSLGDLLERECFRAVRTTLMHDLQIRKLQKESSVHFEWVPFAQRCQACEVRPATSVYELSADRPMLCEACKAKRDKGREERLPRRFHDYLVGRLQREETIPYLQGVEVPEPTPENILNAIDRAEDLDELSDKRCVGVIAADGDGVGRILTQLNSLREYREFSDNLYRLSNQCVYEPLARLLRVCKRQQPRPRQQRWFHPFELVTLGGDDLFLIVPANKTLTVAQSITDYWQNHCPEVIPENRRNGADKIDPPTLSLGLLICPHTFPLYFMHQLAEGLLQRAKSQRSKKGAEEGFIDFLILKSSGTPRTDARQIQETLYAYLEERTYGGAVSLRLTERPYPLTTFAELVQTACALRRAGMTRTQRHALARSLRLGRLRSTMDVTLYWARRSERDEKGRQIRDCLMKWVERLQNEPGGLLVFPWRQDNRRPQETWTTQLLDVLELMEWVEVKESATTGDDGNVGSSNAA